MDDENCPYRIERVTENNFHDVVTVFRDVFNPNADETFLRKKYATDYLGVKYIGYLAYNDDYPIGYHGAIPFLVELQGKTQLAVQGCDAMTHPKHNGRGLFVYLGKKTEELIKKEGISMVYGWPNQKSSLVYFRKLKWTKTGTMKRYHIRVSTLPLSHASKISSLTTYTYTLYQRLILNQFRQTSNVFSSSVIDDEHGGLHRNEAFFIYKRALGSDIYQIAGCKIWMKIDGALLIGDIEHNSEANILKLLKALQRLCRLLGIQEIRFQCSPDCFLDKILSRHYVSHDSWEIGGKNFADIIPLEKMQFTYGDLDTF
ncbi:Uncharacterised protein [BD1-7 clade bacterium]|uniref:N-acetyltransferase domain-containing protein n=1 Tax=BD1-7 clade bacterium TaxID=2029982 RepID=A0A5S9PFF5_9GAMM|nr:Uncharacterised protein [BD1-7 clade bacterium]